MNNGFFTVLIAVVITTIIVIGVAEWIFQPTYPSEFNEEVSVPPTFTEGCFAQLCIVVGVVSLLATMNEIVIVMLTLIIGIVLFFVLHRMIFGLWYWWWIN